MQNIRGVVWRTYFLFKGVQVFVLKVEQSLNKRATVVY